jgi:hypothetical protein
MGISWLDSAGICTAKGSYNSHDRIPSNFARKNCDAKTSVLVSQFASKFEGKLEMGSSRFLYLRFIEGPQSVVDITRAESLGYSHNFFVDVFALNEISKVDAFTGILTRLEGEKDGREKDGRE